MARFDLKTPRKRRSLNGERPRRNRMRHAENSKLPYWIAAVITLLLIVTVLLVREWPAIHGWWTAWGSAPPSRPSPAAMDQADQMLRDLDRKLAVDKKRQAIELARAKAAAAKAQAEAAIAKSKAQAAAEIAGLEARIAAMEASRFWKLRNAWFRLKGTLGIGPEAGRDGQG